MFKLDTSMAAWRRMLECNPALSGEDVAELVQHLRDQVAALTAEGLDEEEAFRRALALMGDYATAEQEYRKVYWGKLRRRGEVLHELRWRLAMLRNYLKIAFRNLLRQKGYAFINVFGLAAGIACCILIALFVQDELRYDRFHTGADRIYRINTNEYSPNAPPDYFALTSRPVGAAIRAHYPEVEAVVRLDPRDPVVIHEGTYFYDDDFLIAEPSFFDVFSFPLVVGDPETVLRQPYTMVLTETTARKYFGDADPVGRTLLLSTKPSRTDTLTFTVTGVVADVPAHSHLDFDGITSWSTDEIHNPVRDDEWLALNSYAYVLLKEGTNARTFAQKISDLITRNHSDQLRRSGNEATVVLEPLRRIYLHSDRLGQIGPTGNITDVYAFSAIAVVVLLIACVNFMNLSTARSMARAKEVGVRKVMGSDRLALIRQFLGESILMTGIATMLAVGIVFLSLPFFNDIAEKEISFWSLRAPVWLLLLFALTITVGLLAGSYPAFALSRFRPAEVLKGAFKRDRGVRLRQALVVFQFAISAVLIVGTLVVMQQLDYMKSQDPGFDREQVVVVDASELPLGEAMANTYRIVKQELAQHPAIASVTASSTIPGRNMWFGSFAAEGLPETGTRRIRVVAADHDFLQTMGIDLVTGRALSEEFVTDATRAALVNESAVRSLGWGSNEEALGKWIDVYGHQTVVGVMEDYHHFSFKEEIEPTVLRVVPGEFSYFSVRVNTRDLPAVLSDLEHTWARLFPNYPFEYFFLDDDFNTQYATEERLTRIFGTFALLAIFIACLGLFGLVSFVTVQRTKEIGVRKVLGASVSGIVVLLTKELIKLVGIALVIAVPLAHFAMQQWLEDFAYRIEIRPGVFVLTGALVLLIALATVSYQSIRAALADPVKSLRYE